MSYDVTITQKNIAIHTDKNVPHDQKKLETVISSEAVESFFQTPNDRDPIAQMHTLDDKNVYLLDELVLDELDKIIKENKSLKKQVADNNTGLSYRACLAAGAIALVGTIFMITFDPAKMSTCFDGSDIKSCFNVGKVRNSFDITKLDPYVDRLNSYLDAPRAFKQLSLIGTGSSIDYNELRKVSSTCIDNPVWPCGRLIEKALDHMGTLPSSSCREIRGSYVEEIAKKCAKQSNTLCVNFKQKEKEFINKINDARRELEFANSAVGISTRIEMEIHGEKVESISELEKRAYFC